MTVSWRIIGLCLKGHLKPCENAKMHFFALFWGFFGVFVQKPWGSREKSVKKCKKVHFHFFEKCKKVQKSAFLTLCAFLRG